MATEVRILDSILTLGSAVAISATSEDVNFPASNIANPLRAKMWRSNGFFQITSSNKYIDFKDAAAGGELTATLTEGDYTRQALIDHIENRMEAVGGQTYTVAFGTGSGKWIISSDGSEFEILWQSGTNTANSIGATLGFDVSADDTGNTSYTGASIALHTVERLIIDLKTGFTGTPIDSCALVFDPVRGIQLTEQATLTLKANMTLDFASPAVSQALSIDDESAIATHFFSANQSYRYWCIEISDPKNPELAVELSTVILAESTQIQKPEIGFGYTVSDPSKKSSNDFGHEYSDVYPNRHGFQFNYAVMDYTDIEALADIYERVGTVTPIAVAVDPTETLFDKDRMFLYGKFSGRLAPKHNILTYFDLPLELEEAF